VLFFIGLTYLWLLVSDPSWKSMNSLRLWAGLAAVGRGAAAEAEEPGMEDGAGVVVWTEKRVHQALQAGRVGPKGMLYPYRRDAMRTDEKYLDGPLVIQQLPGGPNRKLTEEEIKGFWHTHLLQNVLPNMNKQGRATGTIVNIAGLGLQTIDRNAFNTNAHQIEVFFLNYNLLSELPDDLFGKPKKPFFPALRSLYLDHNRLLRLNPSGFALLTRLEGLHLGGNMLEKFENSTWAGLEKLERLTLGGNRLTALPERAFAQLRQLKILTLDRNNIETVSPRAFQGLGRLERLYLDKNPIGSMPAGVFRGLSRLKVLTLDEIDMDMLPLGVYRDLVHELAERKHVCTSALCVRPLPFVYQGACWDDSPLVTEFVGGGEGGTYLLPLDPAAPAPRPRRFKGQVTQQPYALSIQRLPKATAEFVDTVTGSAGDAVMSLSTQAQGTQAVEDDQTWHYYYDVTPLVNAGYFCGIPASAGALSVPHSGRAGAEKETCLAGGVGTGCVRDVRDVRDVGTSDVPLSMFEQMHRVAGGDVSRYIVAVLLLWGSLCAAIASPTSAKFWDPALLIFRAIRLIICGLWSWGYGQVLQAIEHRVEETGAGRGVGEDDARDVLLEGSKSAKKKLGRLTNKGAAPAHEPSDLKLDQLPRNTSLNKGEWGGRGAEGRNKGGFTGGGEGGQAKESDASCSDAGAGMSCSSDEDLRGVSAFTTRAAGAAAKSLRMNIANIANIANNSDIAMGAAGSHAADDEECCVCITAKVCVVVGRGGDRELCVQCVLLMCC